MIDKEQLIEDLHFLSDQGNYKSIKYAIECINKLEKIKQIMNANSYTESGKVYSYCYDNDTRVKHIREVLENE